MSVIKLNNISKIFGTQKVLKDVSIEVNEGDIYGFVGENGAGKTTIIKMITGLIRPNSGSYSLFDVEYTDPKINESRRKIGSIVENPFFYSNMGIVDNLKMQEKLLGIEDPDGKIIDDMIKLVGLEHVDRKLHASKYSLGMKQRLGIAMSLIGDKKLVILDEPLNGVDPEGIVEIRNLILTLNEKGITFFISSHILSELALIVNKVGIISKGQIIKEITKEELNNNSTKTITITTLDNLAAMNVLKTILKPEEMDFVNDKFIIKSQVDRNTILTELTKNMIVVTSIETTEVSLEQYYMDAIGGNRKWED